MSLHYDSFNLDVAVWLIDRNVIRSNTAQYTCDVEQGTKTKCDRCGRSKAIFPAPLLTLQGSSAEATSLKPMPVCHFKCLVSNTPCGHHDVTQTLLALALPTAVREAVACPIRCARLFTQCTVAASASEALSL